MRPQVWMASALMIGLLAPPAGVVGQLPMKLKLAPATAPADQPTPAQGKRSVQTITMDLAGGSIQMQKLKEALSAIQDGAGKGPDRLAAPKSEWPASDGRDRLTTEDSDRPIVYRAGRLPADLPKWFARLDTDSDGQVGLYEWRESDWPTADFQRLDRNGDGFLTIEEMLSVMARAQARGIADDALVRQLPSDFRPTAHAPPQVVQLGETKRVDALPPGLKLHKVDRANGPEQGLKPKKAEPTDDPPIKGKGSKPGKPIKDGL